MFNNVYSSHMYILYSIYFIIVYAALTLLIHIFVIPFLYLDLWALGSCCEIVRYDLLDIAALSELEAQAFRYTCNNIW